MLKIASLSSSSYHAGAVRPPSLLVVVLLMLLSQRGHHVDSYPVIVQIDEESERCFRFNIPGHDEGHLIAMTLPNDIEIGSGDLETFYSDQVFKITKQKTKERGLDSKIPDDVPSDIAQKMSDYLQKNGGNMSPITMKVTDTPSADRPTYRFIRRTKYFLPTVVNFVQRTIRSRPRNKNDKGAMMENLEGYGVCFANANEDKHVHIAFDVVLQSEEIRGGADIGKATDFSKEKHLTPLESSLEQSISAAHSVLREMKYMEQREARMRKTAESINSRVRWFSYLSVGVLLVVTYVQVSYLKRYFHKKKLM